MIMKMPRLVDNNVLSRTDNPTVPKPAPIAPPKAKLQTNFLGNELFLYRQVCHMLGTMFGRTIIATANGTSYIMANAGTANKGAPAPVAPLRIPPKAKAAAMIIIF